MTQRDNLASPTSEMSIVFDPESLAVIGDVFDKAWASLSPRQNDNTARTDLAECVLHSAIAGERDPARLLDGALKQCGRMYEPCGEDAERSRLDIALDEGLEETFPASDAIAAVQPVATESRGTRKRPVWPGPPLGPRLA
jgi:hypothetical protein